MLQDLREDDIGERQDKGNCDSKYIGKGLVLYWESVRQVPKQIDNRLEFWQAEHILAVDESNHLAGHYLVRLLENHSYRKVFANNE